jgi:hypothetical protein
MKLLFLLIRQQLDYRAAELEALLELYGAPQSLKDVHDVEVRECGIPSKLR